MDISAKKAQFLSLVDELEECGYLKSEVYAIAKIDETRFHSINAERLNEGINVLKNQLVFAKKCLKAL